MIKIKVNYDDSYIKNFKVSGHANYDEYGKDIVCASVSSIVITSCNLALKFNENAIKLVQKEGLVDIDILINDDIINKVFINMLDMLKELSIQYEKNVKII